MNVLCYYAGTMESLKSYGNLATSVDGTDEDPATKTRTLVERSLYKSGQGEHGFVWAVVVTLICGSNYTSKIIASH